jgi:N-acetylglucosaminyldiphosphoundecaprenol N-acetyl-beta-D-mannosaminyltransferase
MIVEKSLVWPPKVDLFGVGISAATYDEITESVIEAAQRRIPATVTAHPVHGVVTAARHKDFRNQVNSFEVVAPDGQPVRWAMNRLRGTQLTDRVYGPELTLRICRKAMEEGVPIYLYGSTPEVIESLTKNLRQQFPKLEIAGAESPPYRELTAEETAATVDRINSSGAGILFIGLGCPKQDRFAFAHRKRIEAVQVCVGAAFDFHAGTKMMAPAWMQRHGLEWLFRLATEPRRLWRRYLVTNTLFLLHFLRAMIHRESEPTTAPHSPWTARRIAKRCMTLMAAAITGPMIGLSNLEARMTRNETWFNTFAAILSLIPGKLGEQLRLGYYRFTLERCSMDVCFLFGSRVTHRAARIGTDVIVGTYSTIGTATVGDHVLISAKVSILSGGSQHDVSDRTRNITEAHPTFERTHIASNTWLGEGSLILADVGKRCVVAAGSVVFRPVPDDKMAIGNPARPISTDFLATGKRAELALRTAR